MSEAATESSVIVPAAGERISLFIFIATITSSGSPSCTSSPTRTSSSEIWPVIGAVRRTTPAMAGASVSNEPAAVRSISAV